MVLFPPFTRTLFDNICQKEWENNLFRSNLLGTVFSITRQSSATSTSTLKSHLNKSYSHSLEQLNR